MSWPLTELLCLQRQMSKVWNLADAEVVDWDESVSKTVCTNGQDFDRIEAFDRVKKVWVVERHLSFQRGFDGRELHRLTHPTVAKYGHCHRFYYSDGVHDFGHLVVMYTVTDYGCVDDWLRDSHGRRCIAAGENENACHMD